jgi:hypothetical protein
MKKLVVGASALLAMSVALDSNAAEPTVAPPGIAPGRAAIALSSVSITLASGSPIAALATQVDWEMAFARDPTTGALTTGRAAAMQPMTFTAPLPTSTQYLVTFGSGSQSAVLSPTLELRANVDAMAGSAPTSKTLEAIFRRAPGGATDWKTWALAPPTSGQSMAFTFAGRTISARTCYVKNYALVSADAITGGPAEALNVVCPMTPIMPATITGATGPGLAFAPLTAATAITSATWSVGGVSFKATTGYVTAYVLDQGSERVTVMVGSPS